VSGVFNPSAKPADDALRTVISHFSFTVEEICHILLPGFLASRGTKHVHNQNSSLWYVMLKEFVVLDQSDGNNFNNVYLFRNYSTI